jgi:Zn-dependent peptidase ImmA (M78 family)
MKGMAMRLEQLQERRDAYSQMSPLGRDLSTVYSIGEDAAKAVDWNSGFDLAALIRKLNGTIHYINYSGFRQYEELFENSIYVHDDISFDILLPAYATLAENRFTIAHELGHYLLHRKPMTFACRKGETQVEKEADCFALGFLMPRAIFEQYVKKYRTLTGVLATAFLVPEFAIQARLYSLGLEPTDI